MAAPATHPMLIITARTLQASYAATSSPANPPMAIQAKRIDLRISLLTGFQG
jgi:hypothetical protein